MRRAWRGPQASSEDWLSTFQKAPGETIRMPLIVSGQSASEVLQVPADLVVGAHARESQHAWLEASQGMNSYLASMEEMSCEVGKMSGRFEHAEGWRRRLNLGYAPWGFDPLTNALGDGCANNPKCETAN